MTDELINQGQRRRQRTLDVAGALVPDRLPPHDVEAEQGLLGTMLLDPNETLDNVLTALPRPEAFYDLKHQLIYSTLRDMREESAGIDVISLQARLKACNQIDAVGGIPYLMTLADAVPSAANWPYYATIVADRWLLRRTIRVASETLENAFNLAPGETAQQLVRKLDGRVFEELSIEDRSAKIVHIKEALGEVITDLEDMHRGIGMINGIPTGFGYLDKKTGGLKAGQLIVIGARPGKGKTSLAGSMALNMAMKARKKVGFFTMEMDYKEIAFRLLCGQARVDGSKLRDGFASEQSVPKLVLAAGALSKEGIWFDDAAAQDIDALRASARRMKARHGVDLIVVDYFQLMKSETKSGQGRANELAHVSNGMKALAKELKIPVVLLAQLNREYEKGQRRGQHGEEHPRMSDLKDCGALEQDADVILFIYANTKRVERVMKEHNLDPKENHPRELPYAPMNLWLEKQRSGPMQIDIELKYWREFTLFEDAYDNRGKAAAEAAERGGGAPSRKTDRTPTPEDFADVAAGWPREDE